MIFSSKYELKCYWFRYNEESQISIQLQIQRENAIFKSQNSTCKNTYAPLSIEIKNLNIIKEYLRFSQYLVNIWCMTWQKTWRKNSRNSQRWPFKFHINIKLDYSLYSLHKRVKLYPQLLLCRFEIGLVHWCYQRHRWLYVQ